MEFTLRLRMQECVRMSEVTIATRLRDSAQPKEMKVSIELRTILRILTFLEFE